MGNFVSWIRSNLPDMRADEANKENKPQSAWGIIDTLVPVLAVSLVLTAIFLYYRRSQRRFYAPRSYLGSMRSNERSPDLPRGWFNWIGTFYQIPDSYTITRQGLDAYLFLRYLRICTIITFVSLCVTWPILFPVNATGRGGQSQLEILSYSNVSVDLSPNRFYAHVFVGWLVYGFTMYMVMRECIFYINLRQAYLLTPHYSKRISARTVLFTSVPADYLDEGRIRHLFGSTVKRVWIPGKTEELDEMVTERDKTAMKLEAAEVKLIKAANKRRLKGTGKEATPRDTTDVDAELAENGRSGTDTAPDSKRPSHRLGALGLVGGKVDSIEWCRSELQKSVPDVQKAQDEYLAGNHDKAGAVFVEFNTQDDAQAAYQTVTHHRALHMCPKVIGVTPGEVIWPNLSISWWHLVLRRYAVYAFIAVLIIFWAIPVAITGVIAQVSTLQSLPGMGWIGSIPKPLLGVIAGLLPAVALSILMSFVPIIMRKCAILAGKQTLSQVELFTQNSFFCFQVVQVFLIRSLADAASTAIINIVQDPGSVFTTLGNSLPTSSNFYISYFMVQGLTIATDVVTQVVGFFVFRIMYRYFSSTPRAKYNKWTTLSPILWGSLFPVYSMIVVISLIFSVIAPMILFWSTLALALFYLAYRYNILFVSETAVSTQGLCYPRALKHLFAGIYIAEICMVGLFAVSKAIGPCVLMAIFLVVTVLFHTSMMRYLSPLLYGLPRSVETLEDDIRAGTAGEELEEEGLVHNKESNRSSVGTAGKAAILKKALPGGGEAGVERKGNIFVKFFKPWYYADYATMRKLVPRESDMDFERQYTEEVQAKAYLPPSVTSKAPTLWVPEDEGGVSKQEVAATSQVIGITDEGATLNDKNDIEWDQEGARPPIYEEKIYY